MTDYHTSGGLRGRKVLGAVGKACRVRTYEAGRVCVVEGCSTRLSMYNPSPTCACHTAIWRNSMRKSQDTAPRREPEVRTCAHDPCGQEFVTTNPARKYCSDACRMRAFQARCVRTRRDHDLGETARAS
jgi:hypothetical protein